MNIQNDPVKRNAPPADEAQAQKKQKRDNEFVLHVPNDDFDIQAITLTEKVEACLSRLLENWEPQAKVKAFQATLELEKNIFPGLMEAPDTFKNFQDLVGTMKKELGQTASLSELEKRAKEDSIALLSLLNSPVASHMLQSETPNVIQDNIVTYLQYAVRYQQIDLAQELFQIAMRQIPRFNAQHSGNVLASAVQGHSFLSSKFFRSIPIGYIHPDTHNALVIQAIDCNDEAFLDNLLQVDISAKNESVLIKTIQKGNAVFIKKVMQKRFPHISQELLKLMPDFNFQARDLQGVHLFLNAWKAKNKEVCEFFLQLGQGNTITIGEPPLSLYTHLYLTALAPEYAEWRQMLTKKGADLSSIFCEYLTVHFPKEWSTTTKTNEECTAYQANIESFVKLGAPQHLKNNLGHFILTNLLDDYFKVIKRKKETLSCIKWFKSKNFEINGKDEKRDTLLISGLTYGNASVLNYLINHGDMAPEDCQDALWRSFQGYKIATQSRKKNLVKLTETLGSHINPTLVVTLHNHNPTFAKDFLEWCTTNFASYTNVNQSSNQDMPLLLQMINVGRFDLAKALVKAGANVYALERPMQQQQFQQVQLFFQQQQKFQQMQQPQMQPQLRPLMQQPQQQQMHQQPQPQIQPNQPQLQLQQPNMRPPRPSIGNPPAPPV